MKLTKSVSELQAGDVFYVGSNRFLVEEVSSPLMQVFWKGDTAEEIETVGLLLESEYLTGWEYMPANDTVCTVSPAEYDALQAAKND